MAIIAPLPPATIRTQIPLPLRFPDGYTSLARAFSFDGLADGPALDRPLVQGQAFQARVAGTRPAMALSVVVLPAPFEPSSATTLPTIRMIADRRCRPRPVGTGTRGARAASAAARGDRDSHDDGEEAERGCSWWGVR